MVDGKVCNALSESHPTKCYICEAKPTDMNNLNEYLEIKVSTKCFEFGLSALHAKIRFFEYFLHLSYKSDIKIWQARGLQQKQKVLERKREARRDFRDKIGLIVDHPRDGGKGTPNDGFLYNFEVTTIVNFV